MNKNNRVGFTTNQLLGHVLFYFGVFNPKDAKFLVSIFGQKNSKNSQVSLDCPREDERSNMLLEDCESAHIFKIK